MGETAVLLATSITTWALGLSIGYFVLRRPLRLIKLGDSDPAKRCPACHGTGRRGMPPLTPIAAFNCDECGARAGGHHADVCSRARPPAENR
jgi:hypothetical protein